MPRTAKLGDHVFPQKFGFKGFLSLVQVQMAFHAVTRAHEGASIYTAVKTEWEHSTPCAIALAVKSLFFSSTEIYHPQSGHNDNWEPQNVKDKVQEDKLLSCAKI